jgi:transcriptional regulator with GAF, ATPase, and Fis domain
LFGHEKGSFTGAVAKRVGAFTRADGGTLFLDEIGDCDPAMQAKLLRVLQPLPEKGPCDREFYPVGADKPATADVRVIVATNRDLVEDIRQSRFRDDLYYRLAVISLHLPPLRERKKDIPLLAASLLDQINKQFRDQKHAEPGYQDKRLSASAIAFVISHPWPGNVRQLQNALLQAAAMADGDTIERGDLATVGSLDVAGRRNALEVPLGAGFDLEEHLKSIQRYYLQRAMEEAHGVKAEAARLLGYENYQTLAAQLKRLGVEWQAAIDER